MNPKVITKNSSIKIDFKLEGLPLEVLRKILNLLEKITILDPAVGVGYFLQVSFAILLSIHKVLIKLGIQKKPLDQIRLEIITRNLYGVDLSEKAIEFCQESLLKLISEKSSVIDERKLVTLLKLHIKMGNSLIGNVFNEEDQ